MTDATTAAILWPALTIGGMALYGLAESAYSRLTRRRRDARAAAERRTRDAGR